MFTRHSGWLTLAPVIALAGGIAGALVFAQGHFGIGGALMLGGALLLCWPGVLTRAHPVGDDTPAHPVLALLVVCAVAVFFRTYQLEPPGLWGDEAINGLRAFDVLDGTITSPFQLVSHPHTAFHALSNYPIAAAFRLFGPGPVTLRLPGILAGIACVPLLYATVSPLLGARTALFAALFFATSPMQVAHAKGLTQMVFGEFAQLAGMCLLVRGALGRRRWLMAAAGVPLALCVYTYHSGKIAPLVAVTLFIWPLVRRDRTRPALGWWLAAAAVFLLSVSPAVLSYWRNPEALTGRAGDVALWPVLKERGDLWPLWDAVWRTVTVYHYQQGPVDYHWFGLGTDPGANAIVAFLAVAGLLLSLRRWRETRHAVLLVWFAICLIPGFLSVGAPRGYRILYATPPLYAWAALPLAQMLSAATEPGWRRRVARGVVALLLVAVPFVDFNDYFYRVYTHPVFRWYQAQRMVEMARTLRSYGPGWTGVLLADGFDARYETLLFLTRAWELTLRNVTSLASELPVREPGAGILFIFAPGNIGASIAVKAFYPEGEVDLRPAVPQRSWLLDAWLPLGPAQPQEPVAAFFPVSRDTAAAAHGLRAMFTSDGTGAKTERLDPNLDFESGAAPTGFAGPVAGHWTGALDAPRDGLYELALRSTDEAGISIGGRRILTHDHAESLEPLPEGLQPFAADAVVSPTSSLRLLWGGAPGQAPVPVPPGNFFRFDHVFGLRAEYDVAGRQLARIEPFPYYFFFAPTFDHPFAVHWRGSLRVPADGYRLDWAANGQPVLTIDGRQMFHAGPVAAGEHQFDLLIRGVPPVAHLQLYWIPPNGERELIPPQAFTPPGG